jgi:hypothetical protein
MLIMTSVFGVLSDIFQHRSSSCAEKQEAKSLVKSFVEGRVHTAEDLLVQSNGMLQTVAREADIYLSTARTYIEKQYPHLFKDNTLGNTLGNSLDKYLATCKTAKQVKAIGPVYLDPEISIRDFSNGIRHIQRIVYQEKVRVAESEAECMPDSESTPDSVYADTPTRKEPR